MVVPIATTAVVVSAFSDLLVAGDTVSKYRRRRIEDLAEKVITESQLDGETIVSVLERDELICEIVERGIEGAIRSSAEKKRSLFAKVVANALNGSGLAKPDEYLVLMKTVESIDPLHVQLLVTLATPIRGKGSRVNTRLEGALTTIDILERWPDIGVVLGPALATLEREDLIRNVGMNTYDTMIDGCYGVTDYGRLFLRFVSRGELGELNLESAEITARLDGSQNSLVVIRNLGSGIAREIQLSGDACTRDMPPAPFDLGPGAELEIEAVVPTLAKSPPYNVTLDWEDSAGPRRIHLRLADISHKR